MKRPRIAVYTMAKNEAAHVARYAETTRGADVVVVTDTGSTDGTPDLLRDHGIQVHTANIVPWRFDTATNCALCHVPADIDICVKLDLDEVLFTNNGTSWRDALTELWTEGIRQVNYWYTWSWYVPGKVPAVKFRTANVHSRSGFVWRHAGHAALCSTQPGKTVNSENFEIHHYMTGKGRPDYLSLLQLAVKENRCPRTLFYLGRELSFRKQHTECINTLTEYLGHPEAYWKAERANAMRHIAVAHEQLGNQSAAMGWLFRAHSEYPGVRDLWYETLRFFHDIQDFQGGYWAGLKCLAVSERDRQWTAHTAAAWSDAPFVLLANCCHKLHNTAEAIRFLQEALKINRDNPASKSLAAAMGLGVT